MIDEDPRLRRCFPEPSVVAYKRSKSLRDILVRAKISKGKTSQRPQSGGFRPCQRYCTMCSLTGQSLVDSHKSTRSGETWKINGPLTCETKGCIYPLTCRKDAKICREFLYIGETGKRACDRFQQHRGYVTQKKVDTPAGEHFNLKGHEIKDMNFLPIERVLPASDTELRKTIKSDWIRHYDSVN